MELTISKNDYYISKKGYEMGQYVNFNDLCDICFSDMILLNNIEEIDEDFSENLINWCIEHTPEFDENGEEIEDELEYWEGLQIYQYFIVNENKFNFEKYKDAFIVVWSEKLNHYVLCVDFWGLSWSLVSTNVKVTE